MCFQIVIPAWNQYKKEVWYFWNKIEPEATAENIWKTVVKIMVMIITQTSRERQFQFTAWGLMPVSISSVCFVNVFQAAQMYHYYAVKNNSKSVFVSVTCWRTCQNMQRSISHGHRNLEIHIADQTHTHTHLASPLRDDILHHGPKHIS